MIYKEKIKDYIGRILKWSDSIVDENGKSFSYYPSEQQLSKVHEEVHELVQAMLEYDEWEQKDAIGDIFVTLIVYLEKVMNEGGYKGIEKELIYDLLVEKIEHEMELCDAEEDAPYLERFLYQLSILNLNVSCMVKIHAVENSLVRLVLGFNEYDFLERIDLAVSTIEQRLRDGRLYIENGVVKKDKK